MAVSVISRSSGETVQKYTGYSLASGLTATDDSVNVVEICGKICCFSLNFKSSSDKTFGDEEVLVTGMPIPKGQMIFDACAMNSSNKLIPARVMVSFDGEIKNWWSKMKAFANKTVTIEGIYSLE